MKESLEPPLGHSRQANFKFRPPNPSADGGIKTQYL